MAVDTHIMTSVDDVHEYLIANGFTVGRATLFRHRKAGKLLTDDAGRFPADLVNKYATLYLKRGKGRAVIPAPVNPAGSDPQGFVDLDEKRVAEIRKITAQAHIAEINAKKLTGEYVEREWAERQLAARAMVLKSDFENFYRARSADIVAKCDGKADFIPDVIDYLLSELEKLVGRYAAEIEFKTTMNSGENESIGN